jgi:hypothetical protein
MLNITAFGVVVGLDDLRQTQSPTKTATEQAVPQDDRPRTTASAIESYASVQSLPSATTPSPSSVPSPQAAPPAPRSNTPAATPTPRPAATTAESDAADVPADQHADAADTKPESDDPPLTFFGMPVR